MAEDHDLVLPEWPTDTFPPGYMDKDPMTSHRVTLIFVTVGSPSLIYPYLFFFQGQFLHLPENCQASHF